MSSCGAETHLLFTGHSAIDASDTSARRAWSERWLANPKGRIETEPRGPSQLRGVRGVARIAPSQLRIVTTRHGLEVFVIILPCFGYFGWPFPSQDGPPPKKCHFESGLSQRDRATAGFSRGRSRRKPSKIFYCRGFVEASGGPGLWFGSPGWF